MTEIRTAVLEEKVENLEDRMQKLETEIGEIKSDVKLILQLANMGKGAGWLIIKGGSVIAALVAAFWAAYTYFRAH